MTKAQRGNDPWDPYLRVCLAWPLVEVSNDGRSMIIQVGDSV